MKDPRDMTREELVAECERYRAANLEYENCITWDTTCKNCAKLMDKNYEQYVALEEMRRERDELESRYHEIENKALFHDDALARAEAAERERDELNRNRDWLKRHGEAWEARAEAAERALLKAREAPGGPQDKRLEEIRWERDKWKMLNEQHTEECAALERERDRQWERAEAAERERDELKDEARKNFDWAKAERSGRKQERTRADNAEARAEAVERERDGMRKRLAWYEGLQGDANDADFAAIVRDEDGLEARVRRYEEAIKAYDAIFRAWEGRDSITLNDEAIRQWRSIARAALTEEQNTGVDKDGHAHYEPRWNLREIELWMAALGFAPEQKEKLISALTTEEQNTVGGGQAGC